MKKSVNDVMLFIGAATLLVITNFAYFYLFNVGLGNVDIDRPVNYSYYLTVFILTWGIFFAVIALQRKGTYKMSWFVPICYVALCSYAACRTTFMTTWDTRITAYIYSAFSTFHLPLSSIACMIAFEWIFARDNQVKFTKRMDFLILLLCLFGVYMITKQMLFERSGEDYNLSNNIYFLIPLIVYWTTKRQAWVLVVSVLSLLIFSVMSLKRGSLVVSGCIIATLMWNYKIRSFILFKVVLAIAALGVGIKIMQYIDSVYFYGQLSERFETIWEGSGRRDQYAWVFQSIDKFSPGELLVGRGGNSSVDSYGFFIHNDWLRLMFEYGIVAVVLYSCIAIFFIYKIFELRRAKSPYIAAYSSLFVFFIVYSLYGAVAWVYILNILPVMGCIMGMEKRRILAIRVMCKYPNQIRS